MESLPNEIEPNDIQEILAVEADTETVEVYVRPPRLPQTLEEEAEFVKKYGYYPSGLGL